MRQDYYDRLQQKKNLCNAYMDKAEMAFIDNGRRHCAEECTYLQQAATLRSEMAQMSTDAERQHHLDKLSELNRVIEQIRRTCDPDYIQRENAARRAVADRKPAGTGKKEEIPAEETGKSGAPKGKNSKREAVSDEEVAGWYKDIPKHSFDDVSGMTELKEQLKSCIEDSKDNVLRAYMKLKSVHSFFFIGPPGCGKTYIIEAFAHELMQKDFKYISLDASNIKSKFVGDAEKIVKRMFEEALNAAPCIVFVDEIESVCKNRSLKDLPEYASSITTAFLTGYNMINESDKTIIFIGATNYPGQVDNAMLDRVEKIRVPFPDEGARAGAFSRHFSKLIQLEEGLSYDYMAEMTNTYNYRDIDHLAEAMKIAIYRDVTEKYGNGQEAVDAMKSGKYVMTKSIFDDALERVLPTPKDDIIRDLDAWEEKFRRDVELGE